MKKIFDSHFLLVIILSLSLFSGIIVSPVSGAGGYITVALQERINHDVDSYTNILSAYSRSYEYVIFTSNVISDTIVIRDRIETSLTIRTNIQTVDGSAQAVSNYNSLTGEVTITLNNLGSRSIVYVTLYILNVMPSYNVFVSKPQFSITPSLLSSGQNQLLSISTSPFQVKNENLKEWIIFDGIRNVDSSYVSATPTPDIININPNNVLWWSYASDSPIDHESTFSLSVPVSPSGNEDAFSTIAAHYNDPFHTTSFDNNVNVEFDSQDILEIQGPTYFYEYTYRIGLSIKLPETLDSDGDGLYDNWEIYGIDNNEDGIVDLILPDCNRFQKDVYVEVDWMVGYQPSFYAINEVVDVFANNGINLHVFLSNSIPHSEYITFDLEPGDLNTVDFDEIKSNNFDSNRKPAFHYCIFADKLKDSPKSSGQAEVLGNDFMVTLGDYHYYIPNQIGTFMHELGHNLGLRHGGDENTNHKPNYISNMNYLFQFGIEQKNGEVTFDWSHGTLPSLNEWNLNENLGIQGGEYYTKFIDPTNPSEIIEVLADGPIDWDQDNVRPYENFVIQNINNDTFLGVPILGILHDYNDWANLNFGFQNNQPNFEDGVHLDVVDPNDEISHLESLQLMATIYTPSESLENLKAIIKNLNDYAFTVNRNIDAMKKALLNKIDEVILKINSENYHEAIQKLSKDIKSKIDGNPKNKDWIIDNYTQISICQMIDNIINQINN